MVRNATRFTDYKRHTTKPPLILDEECARNGYLLERSDIPTRRNTAVYIYFLVSRIIQSFSFISFGLGAL